MKSYNIKYEMTIKTNTEADKMAISESIHNQLKCNPDYIDSRIIMINVQPCTVTLLIYDDATEIPDITIPFIV